MPALSTVDGVWDTSILLVGEAVTPSQEELLCPCLTDGLIIKKEKRNIVEMQKTSWDSPLAAPPSRLCRNDFVFWDI